MLAQQRHDRILELVDTEGGVRVADLVDELGVSEMTIRRDIADMAAQGLLVRVHGGAIPLEQHAKIEEIGKKAEVNRSNAEVVSATLAHLQAGQVIGIGTGSMSTMLAERLAHLPFFASLQLVTNSFAVASALFPAIDRLRQDNQPAPELLFVGGEPTQLEMLGPLAERTIESICLDVVCLEPDGFAPSGSVTASSLARASYISRMVRMSAKVVAMMSERSWMRMGRAVICELQAIDRIVSDFFPPAEQRDLVEVARVDVEYVG
ncbi:MAG: DeoR/GlpR family DNA-binding transcription regulator [Varibaculum sp.]|nr:DeoR/GlpR family DNA-binding transcription regulator [Varibaculum sp.]